MESAIWVAGRNTSLQCLRGLAALSVVLYHTSFYYEAAFGPAVISQVTMSRFAFLGVSVFFAISGSLMAQILPRTDPWKFLAHRAVRIYPTFFVVVAALLPLGVAFHVMPPPVALLALTLAPVGNAGVYYLHVEWTLVYECTYYVALFAIALCGARHYLNLIATAWIGAILIAPAAFMGWNTSNVYPLYSILLSPPNIAFAGGLLVPWLYRNLPIPAGVGILAACLFVAVLGNISNATYAWWVAGAVATLLVLDAFRVPAPQGPATPPFLKLGDWSYGLYLSHAVIILLILKLFSNGKTPWPAGWMAGGLALGGALVFGCAFGAVDVWLYAKLKARADSAGTRTLQVLVAAYVAIFVAAALASFLSVSDQTQIRRLQEFVRSHGWSRLLSHPTPSNPGGAR